MFSIFRPSDTRTKSPEKPRDYISPTEKLPVKNEKEPKPRRGDQSPDSLDKEDISPQKVPDVIAKIPLKEQCICELCTCG